MTTVVRDWRDEVVNEVEEFGRGWALEGSFDRCRCPIDRDVLAATLEFLAHLPDDFDVTKPRVVPMSDGGLQFEWYRGEKSLEVEFETHHGRSVVIHYLKWDPPAGVEEEDLFPHDDRERSLDLLRWLVGFDPQGGTGADAAHELQEG